MSVRNPYKKQETTLKETKEKQSYNRSTLYHYFKDCGMQMRFTNINNRRYKVFIPDYKWEDTYLTINGFRFANFQSIIIFTNELVIRYNMSDNIQVNIPYKLIESIQLDNDLDIGYEEIHL